MSIFSDISDIPLRIRFSFSGNKVQHQTFEEFRKAQRKKTKKLVLIKAKDRPFPKRFDDVLVRLKGVPRYYPDKDDNSKTENEKEEPFSVVKYGIKIIDKIEPDELDLLNQRTLSKKQEKTKAAKEKEKKQEEIQLQNLEQIVSPKTKSKQPVNIVHIDVADSFLKPDIKVVDKIDLALLNQRTRPKKKSKKQLKKERKERFISSGKKTKKQLAQERKERLQLAEKKPSPQEEG